MPETAASARRTPCPAAPGPRHAAALRRIREIVGPKGWTDDPTEMAPYLVDERAIYHGRTPAVVRPATTDEVAQVVRCCAEAGIAVVPQGGNTSLCGGAVPSADGGELLLGLGRLNRIRAIDPLNHTITVEAGCILARVQEAAAAADRLFPLSLGAEGSCQIGGNLSTNAGGTGVLRYGNARDLVMGLEVVLADGRVWDGLKGLRKDNTGYDLKHLFIGAEGTLGIITAAVLKLFPRPRETATALAAVRDIEDAIELLARLRTASADAISGFELMEGAPMALALDTIANTADPFARRYDHYALIELSAGRADSGIRETLENALGEALEEGLVLDAAIAASQAQAAGLWRLREAIPEAQKKQGLNIKHDVSVPVSSIAAFIRSASERCRAALPGIRIYAFGHVGDGNVHFNLVWPEGGDEEAFRGRWGFFNRIVHDAAAELGGSISAEHGIGRLKREELARYAPGIEIDLMRRLKAALDPQAILNPGKVIPEAEDG